MEILQKEDRVAIDFETSSSIKDVEILFHLSTYEVPSEGSATRSKLEVCHPRCVCENWKGFVVKHNDVN